MPLPRQILRHRELRRVARENRLDRFRRGAANALGQRTEVEADHERPNPPQVGRRVVADVTHPVHRVSEQRDLRPPQRGDRLGRGGPIGERGGELIRAPLTGDDGERAPDPDQRVGLVLRAMDALVIGQV